MMMYGCKFTDVSLWKDRIPFVLLFEIASSMDMFQEKLPRTTVRCIQGKAFETADASDTLELLFQTLTSPDRQFPLCFGPNLCGMFFDRQREYQQSAAAFMQGLKVCRASTSTQLLQQSKVGSIPT